MEIKNENRQFIHVPVKHVFSSLARMVQLPVSNEPDDCVPFAFLCRASLGVSAYCCRCISELVDDWRFVEFADVQRISLSKSRHS